MGRGSDRLNDKDDTEINGVLVTDRATYLAIAEKPPNPLTSLRTRADRLFERFAL